MYEIKRVERLRRVRPRVGDNAKNTDKSSEINQSEDERGPQKKVWNGRRESVGRSAEKQKGGGGGRGRFKKGRRRPQARARNETGCLKIV